ncbi:MAG: ATP-binding protein [Coriobacteriia bacterium]|nr:ATP-binding protein [Coriobacteriia bacterium]
MPENNDIPAGGSPSSSISADYSHVLNPARVAVYDDPLIAPRIITIQPAPTTEFIQNLAVCIDEQARRLGGSISYTVILEVTENFIHAQFREVVVSILDGGNTIRFTDQGPGIADIEKAVKPGFTSAIEPMKHYIRGVGSGLPIVHDWVGMKNGHITIDSNIGNGAAVTISMIEEVPEPADDDEAALALRSLGDKARVIFSQFSKADTLGVTDLGKLTGMSPSTVNYQLGKLEDAGLVAANPDKKRVLTPLGKNAIRFV